MNLALIENTLLRSAIRRNLVSFPAQIPMFTKRGEVEERIVYLYFIRGWKVKSICARYGLSRSSVRKVLLDWKNRAVAAGYIQEIDPEGLAELASEPGAHWQEEADESEVYPVREFQASGLKMQTWKMQAMTGIASAP